ncbi:hypothetical protein Tco_0958101, partial [Tanacetum coccineum]
THPKAYVFKDKSFPLYHKLSTIFGKDRANGSRAIDLGDEEDVGETQETTTNDLEEENIDMVDGPSPRGVDGQSKKRKRGKTDELLHMYSESSTTLNNTITLIGNEMNMNLSKMANDNERRVQSEIDLMRRVQNKIDVLPGIMFEEANEAIDVFGSCPLKAERLFGYDNVEKIQMV